MFFVRLPLFALISSLALLSGSSLLPAAPVVSAQIADQSVYDATPALEIDLNTKFNDPTLPANTVRLTTDLGIIDVTLYDQQTPITVDNFLHYIDSGAYIPNDPNFPVPAPIFFHRAVPGFVIQSGGYISAQDPLDPPVLLPGPVTAFSPIPNEARPDLHNVRGTIAMAKLPDDPDSATSQWFINLTDNSGPPNNLDTVNGGFTVFGTVSAAGMTTADAIGALPNYNASLLYGAAFTQLPLRDFTSDKPRLKNLVTIPAITRPLVFSAISDDPGHRLGERDFKWSLRAREERRQRKHHGDRDRREWSDGLAIVRRHGDEHARARRQHFHPPADRFGRRCIDRRIHRSRRCAKTPHDSCDRTVAIGSGSDECLEQSDAGIA